MCWLPEKTIPGGSPEEQAGGGGDLREPGMNGDPSSEESFVDLTGAVSAAPEGSPPAKESGSGGGSNEGKGSNEALFISLRSKLESVSKFKLPAAEEFLKVMAGPTNVFVHLLQENEDLLQEKEHLMQEKEHLMQENKHLLQENKQLQASHETKVAILKDEIQWLKQELKEARSQRARNPIFPFSWFKTDFHIQVLVTGRTESCEKQFLMKVSDLLSNQDIDLKAHKYQESSGHFLIVFCPVSSRVGTDMYNALESLKGDPKAVLVMLHHKPMQSTCFVDTKLQAKHPAVVHTVHARYTIQEGFYTCPMNEEAVDIVAKVLVDCCKRRKVDPATTGTLSKSQNT